MKGKRVYPHDSSFVFQPGDYGMLDDIWYAMSPNGYLANLAGHEVTENSDGTISVKESIAISEPQKEGNKKSLRQLYHGYLINGNWD